MSSEYLKKIRMNSPFGVLLNLQDNIWLSMPVSRAQGLPGDFCSWCSYTLLSMAQSYEATNSRNQGTGCPMRACALLELSHWPSRKCVVCDVITSSNETINIKSESQLGKPQQNSPHNGNLAYLYLYLYLPTIILTRENILSTES